VYQGIQFRSSGDPVLFLSNPKGHAAADRRRVLDTIAELIKGSAATFNPTCFIATAERLPAMELGSAVSQAIQTSQTRPTEELAEVVAKATAAAAQTFQEKWYDERTYPDISVFNPLGEKDHPRPDLHGEVYWAGAMLKREQLTREEIEAVNQLQPGEFWFTGNDEARMLLRIINLEPAGSTQRRLNVILPGLSDPNTRVNYPSMLRILREVLAVPA
jgi:hypothetical protein